VNVGVGYRLAGPVTKANVEATKPEVSLQPLTNIANKSPQSLLFVDRKLLY
jgi:hypothetical protein